MTLRALIFDVDGTLAETEEAHRTAFNETFAAAGLKWNWSIDDYRELLKTTGGKERIRAFQATLPQRETRLKDDEIAELHAEKTTRYGAILASGNMSLRPGVAALIAAARNAGLKLAIATTTNTPNVDALCHCCWGNPAMDVFDYVAAGDMIAQKKPAPDVYNLALSQLDLPATDCLALEDSRNGVLSAQGAGLRVMVTPSIYTVHDDFREADWLLSSLLPHTLPSELSAALTLTGRYLDN